MEDINVLFNNMIQSGETLVRNLKDQDCLTVQKLDRKHLQFVLRKYVEEYGLQDGSQAVDEVLSQWANQWGINYGSEMKASN